MEELPTQITEPVIEIPEGSGAGKALRRRKSNKGRCSTKSSAASSTTSATLLNPPAAEPTVNSAVKGGLKGAATSTTKKSKAASTTTHTSSAATPSAADSSSSKLPSFMSGIQTGQATYYGTGLGSCGITSTDSDYIVAVSHLLYDVFPGYNGANPNDNPVCGQKIKANYQGNSVTATVVDRCTGCKMTDLDFSPSAFSQLADQSLGRLSGMTWEWA
jgi:hypothetical protein